MKSMLKKQIKSYRSVMRINYLQNERIVKRMNIRIIGGRMIDKIQAIDSKF